MISLNDILFGFGSVSWQSLRLYEQKGIHFVSPSQAFMCVMYVLAISGVRIGAIIWQ